MSATKYLDSTGLAYFWSKIKSALGLKADDSGVVHLAGDESITGTKTFTGTKKVAFKQSAANDKLGFTLYSNSNVEQGYLEYNPTNKIDGVPLLTLGNYASAAAGLSYVGFRKYSSVSGASGAYNLLTPLVSDAKTPFNLTTTYTNFFLPLGVTDGTTTFTVAKSGLLDLSAFNAASASAVAWSGVTGKPTTISGYGITDAGISSGTITLGSDTITPLTEDSVQFAASASRAADIAADGTYTVPSYTVGKQQLLVYLDGVLSRQGDGWDEVGTAGDASTTIKFNQLIPMDMEIAVRVN